MESTESRLLSNLPKNLRKFCDGKLNVSQKSDLAHRIVFLFKDVDVLHFAKGLNIVLQYAKTLRGNLDGLLLIWMYTAALYRYWEIFQRIPHFQYSEILQELLFIWKGMAKDPVTMAECAVLQIYLKNIFVHLFGHETQFQNTIGRTHWSLKDSNERATLVSDLIRKKNTYEHFHPSPNQRELIPRNKYIHLSQEFIHKSSVHNQPVFVHPNRIMLEGVPKNLISKSYRSGVQTDN